ncbi:MAG TPA: hypothetical protein VGZ48_00475 [Candidatus Acidoferrales bacterium]|jgi:hypothetical protein|nr:hypothetical protein [Candidatus Acidoferrales bacterium]
MQCSEFEAVLEQTDGQPMSAEATAHSVQCGNCRAMAADLATIARAARELTEPPQEPPARVWLQLRAQLETEGIIRAHVPEKDASLQPQGRFAVIFAWMRRPALIATYAAIMVLAAALVWQQLPPEPPQNIIPTAAQYGLDSLETQAVSDLQSGNPEVNTALRKDLEVVNKFIAECEKAVREEPQNEDARQYLYGAYQQKAELLAVAMDHTRTGE